MQFHQYITVKNRYLRQNKGGNGNRIHLTGIKSAEFREKIINNFVNAMEKGQKILSDNFDLSYHFASAEQEWVDENRPYYNFWPVAISLAKTVRLDLAMKSIELPFATVLLRFPKGHEPYTVGTALVQIDEELKIMIVDCWLADTEKHFFFCGSYELEESAESFIEKSSKIKPRVDQWDEKSNATFELEAAKALMMRLVLFVSLLARGEDLVTPIVLSKDQAKYDQTEEEEVKRWLEDRASRRMGRGFDIGKKMQFEKDKSPHWRNPHFCLFWTGEGRLKPVIKMRSGAIIQSLSMAEVPTGYLGPETEADEMILPESTPRDGISKSRRYDLMKRDGFRCQICGATQASGVVLHIDHKQALAVGGSNLDDNLWTLCEACNLGKSDKPL
ncbi:MAG: HNH endonuclease [Pirellulales bacterium]|nr:HNH endonuclease [Pirellulales bacterium]